MVCQGHNFGTWSLSVIAVLTFWSHGQADESTTGERASLHAVSARSSMIGGSATDGRAEYQKCCTQDFSAALNQRLRSCWEPELVGAVWVAPSSREGSRHAKGGRRFVMVPPTGCACVGATSRPRVEATCALRRATSPGNFSTSSALTDIPTARWPSGYYACIGIGL